MLEIENVLYLWLLMDLYLKQTLYEVRKVEFLVNILVKFLTVTKE